MKTKKQILNEAGYTPVIGRPSIGKIRLNHLMVSIEVERALKTLAKKMKRSIPDLRRDILLRHLQQGNML